MELWDAYRENGSMTGETLVRGQRVPEGLFHLVCEVLVRHRDGSFLAMRRDRKKSGFPGWWETTAGGSALKGEDRWQCAHRELREETGIEAGSFQQIGCEVWPETHCIHISFLCTVDCGKDSIILQPGETEDYRWMSEQAFIEFVNSEHMIPSQKRRLRTWLREMGYWKGAKI